MSTQPVDPNPPASGVPGENESLEPTIIAEQQRDAPTGPKVIPADEEAQKAIDEGKTQP